MFTHQFSAGHYNRLTEPENAYDALKQRPQFEPFLEAFADVTTGSPVHDGTRSRGGATPAPGGISRVTAGARRVPPPACCPGRLPD